MPTLIGQKREGGITTRTGRNGILIREMPFYFTVLGDNEFQDRNEIIFNTQGLPRYGQVYGGMTVRSMDANRQEDHALRWDVVATLSSEVQEDQESRNQQNGQQGSSPLQWTPIANVKFEPYEEVLREDVAGRKWLNSAKKPFETGFVVTKRIAAIPFSQFEPISTKLDDIMKRCDTVNSTPYKDKPEKTLLLTVEDATIGIYSGLRCWRVDYVVRYKEEDWRIKQLDVGWGYYESGQYKKFMDNDNPPSPFLGSLNGSGGKIANQETGNPFTLHFDAFRAIDFNQFLRVLFT